MTDVEIRQIADDAVEMAVGGAGEAQRIAQILRNENVGSEIVAGLCSVSVLFHPLETNVEHVSEALSRARHTSPGARDQALRSLQIPVRYGGAFGPDITRVCEALDLTEDAFIQMHTAHEHKVEMIGFTPGFAYVSGVDPSMSIPRLGTPRARIPAGSVGISGGYTGIYALAGPGGWPLIGRTEMTLFYAEANEPFALHPGFRVRFVAV